MELRLRELAEAVMREVLEHVLSEGRFEIHDDVIANGRYHLAAVRDQPGWYAPITVEAMEACAGLLDSYKSAYLDRRHAGWFSTHHDVVTMQVMIGAAGMLSEALGYLLTHATERVLSDGILLTSLITRPHETISQEKADTALKALALAMW